MEGRLIGIYQSNSNSRQQSSPKYKTYFDSFYGATRLNASSSLFSSYSKPFTSYSRRSEKYRYPSNYSSSSTSSYSNQSYEAMKQPSSGSSSSAPPSEDLVNQMTTEFSLELARGLARNVLSNTPKPNSQSSPIQGGGPGNPILGVQQKEDVFGYRFEICKDCLLTQPLEVNFGKDGTNNNNDNDNDNHNHNAIGRIEQKHQCNPKLVASNKNEVLDKETSVKAMIDDLPKNAIRVTKWWIKNQKNCRLIAVKIPHKSNNDDNIGDKDNNTNNIQPEQENIKILNPINPKQQIIFQYSREKHIQIDNLTSNESSKNHWAARAIKDGHTNLTNDEMEDFLKMIQTSTFAIFKIRIPSTTTASSSQLQQQQHESIGLYFLAILPYNDDTLRSLS
jgi:hypothetical protein